MKRRKGFGFLGILIGMILIFASNASVVLGVDWSELTPSPTGEDLEGMTFGDNLIVARGR
ncbi:MAG: hypothetical protein ABGX83_01865 [Nitrospira sp.]|nr:hypothetical protein [Candidatus Manganitrophaceae bacterium]HIL34462.1 hypothetical protein [Candidatus Manganitrophaceae bacterium]